MTNHKQVVYQSQLDHKSKMVLRRRIRRRFNPRIFVDRTIETTAIVSLLFTPLCGSRSNRLLGNGDCYEFSLLAATEEHLLRRNVGQFFRLLRDFFSRSKPQYPTR
ncbi:hypothetical protein COO91_09877 (plasmid) [Nostoc flagelliforme CCNUN1]|uniref:Uncharacterized protein n=1 Tax=Nostoc flagelliforme CCNUN1 TaxID=2038116 RepID=A0A2K8T7X4_9NOSO|nr:hypothetical protein [Nostoc flagelliforme]AUB43693.1 hypothetical protein COO91_09877 [Nostoc flagelliforme CCNUN1]